MGTPFTPIRACRTTTEFSTAEKGVYCNDDWFEHAESVKNSANGDTDAVPAMCPARLEAGMALGALRPAWSPMASNDSDAASGPDHRVKGVEFATLMHLHALCLESLELLTGILRISNWLAEHASYVATMRYGGPREKVASSVEVPDKKGRE